MADQFPETVLDAFDGSSRRDFMKIMGASFLLGGMGSQAAADLKRPWCLFPKCLTTTPTVWHNILRPMPVRNSAIRS